MPDTNHGSTASENVNMKGTLIQVGSADVLHLATSLLNTIRGGPLAGLCNSPESLRVQSPRPGKGSGFALFRSFRGKRLRWLVTAQDNASQTIRYSDRARRFLLKGGAFAPHKGPFYESARPAYNRFSMAGHLVLRCVSFGYSSLGGCTEPNERAQVRNTVSVMCNTHKDRL
jgi:hypothetical protein